MPPELEHVCGYQSDSCGVAEGGFVDDKRTGRGIYRFVNADRYEGQFLNGKRDGIGFYVEGERVFVEEWDDGIRINRSEIPGGLKAYEAGKNRRHEYDNKDVYVGMMIDGKRVGFGVERFINGETYEGTFLDDKRHGKGIATYANGDVYEGKFANGLKDGPGLYRSTNGRFEGEWRAGRFTLGKVVLSSGTVLEGESNDSMFGITRAEPQVVAPGATFDALRKRPFQGRKDLPKQKGPKLSQ